MQQESYDAALQAFNDRPGYDTMDRLQIAIDVAVETERGEVTEYSENIPQGQKSPEELKRLFGTD